MFPLLVLLCACHCKNSQPSLPHFAIFHVEDSVSCFLENNGVQSWHYKCRCLRINTGIKKDQHVNNKLHGIAPSAFNNTFDQNISDVHGNRGQTKSEKGSWVGREDMAGPAGH